MATIKEVADRAGVSIGTVSHVITGSVPVSEPLRVKVLTAVRDLDYHPNHVARSLKTSRTRTLGIIVPDLTISFFPQLISGAEAAARAKGYSLIAVNSSESGERQKELLSLFRSQQAEGILLVPAASAPESEMSRMMDAGVPLVCVDRVAEDAACDSVSVEDAHAAELGIDHLLERGYRRVAIVTGPLALGNEARRLAGYRTCLQRAGLPLSDDLIWEGNLRPADVAAMCKERLASCTPRPDSLFCTNGPTALGALRALRDSGLSTPKDMGFVTFDELTVDDLFTPAITTIVQPAYEIGFRAADLLLDRIGRKGETPNRAIRLPASLRVRDSSLRRAG